MAVRYYLAPVIQHPSRASLNISRCQLYVGAEVGQQNVVGELSVKSWCVTRVEAPDADAVWTQLDADGLLTRIPVALLDTPVSDLTQAQRDAIAQEMAARNIPYDWVTASVVALNTTVQSVVGPTEIVFSSGSSVTGAYNGMAVLLSSSDTSVTSRRTIVSYSGDTQTAILDNPPGFVVARGDAVRVYSTFGTTLREVIGWVIRLLRLTKLLRSDYPNVSLDQTWGTIPAAVRNRVLTFAANNGISTAGLNTNSTIRQILRRILERYPWPPQGLGPDIF